MLNNTNGGTVRFKDMDGTLLWQTSDAAGAFLSELDEKMPAVKTIAVNVPARDGALDLTESVAGRPLYGNRRIDMTISITASDHPAAVVAVRAMRRAIHGVMCRVETPDNILTGNPPVQGWYVGRVALGAVTYPGEAAVVKLTIDANPWVYYGTGTVTLAHAAPTSYTPSAPIGSADQSRVSDMVVNIGNLGQTWVKPSYPETGTLTTSAAIVLSRTFNMLSYRTMAEWGAWSVPDTGTWAGGWSTVQTWTVDPATATASTETSTGEARRLVLFSTAGSDGTARGVMGTTNYQPVWHIRVRATVTADGGSGLGKLSGLYVFTQGSLNPYGLEDSIGGMIDGGDVPAYSTLWKTGDPTGTVQEYTFEYSPGAGYFIIGIESRWLDADIEVRTELLPGFLAGIYTGTTNPDNTITTLTFPEPLYSDFTGDPYQNSVTIAPYGAFETVELRMPQNSDTAVPITPETIPVQSVALDGSALLVNAYLMTSTGWLLLWTRATLYPWATATIDMGDMPTPMTISVGSPVALDKDGARTVISESGPLPYALSGSAAELDYMVMGDADSTIAFEKGTL